MQVSNLINQPISKIDLKKTEVSDPLYANERDFNDSLIETVNAPISEVINQEYKKLEAITKDNELDLPLWVDPSFSYDKNNPRKPNMRELMEAMSGKNVEDLYKEPEENWQKISSQASEMLYGVIGANKDTRDWPSIMSSNDILKEARDQTGAMYKPEVDIQSYFNEDGILTEQIAVIKDKKGNTLMLMSNDTTSAEEELLNFGATNESIPTNIEERINPEKFDADLLAFLKSFDHSPSSIRQVVVQSASEVIANKISQEIPLQDLAKL